MKLVAELLAAANLFQIGDFWADFCGRD